MFPKIPASSAPSMMQLAVIMYFLNKKKEINQH